MMGVSGVAGAVNAALHLSALVAAMGISHAAFNKKPLVLFFIDHGYDSVCIIAASVVYAFLG